MREFKYDIGLNDEGKPYVIIPKEYDDNPEDKFVVFELTKHILINITPKIKNEQTKGDIEYCIDALDKLSTYVGKLLKQIMISNGEMYSMTNEKTSIPVETYDDLIVIINNNIKHGYLIYDLKMFNVDNGIVFYVKNTNETYSYFDGELILND